MLGDSAAYKHRGGKKRTIFSQRKCQGEIMPREDYVLVVGDECVSVGRP